MQDKRQARRALVFLNAKIVFNNANSTMDCVIRNLSATGAKIALENSIAAPQEFELHIPSKQMKRSCNVRWRTQSRLGVEFKDTLRNFSEDHRQQSGVAADRG